MTKFKQPTLELTLQLPNGWLAIEGKELFAKYMNLSPEQVEGTEFVLVEFVNNEPTRKIRVTKGYGEYSTLWEYFDALSFDVQEMLRDNAIKLKSHTALANSGAPLYHITIRFRSGATTNFSYAYHNKQFLCFAMPIMSDNIGVDNTVMESIVASIA